VRVWNLEKRFNHCKNKGQRKTSKKTECWERAAGKVKSKKVESKTNLEKKAKIPANSIKQKNQQIQTG